MVKLEAKPIGALNVAPFVDENGQTKWKASRIIFRRKPDGSLKSIICEEIANDPTTAKRRVFNLLRVLILMFAINTTNAQIESYECWYKYSNEVYVEQLTNAKAHSIAVGADVTVNNVDQGTIKIVFLDTDKGFSSMTINNCTKNTTLNVFNAMKHKKRLKVFGDCVVNHTTF